MSVPQPLHLVPLPGIPLVQPGDDLATLVREAGERAGTRLANGHLVLCQKVVSKAEVTEEVMAPKVTPRVAARVAQKEAWGIHNHLSGGP